MPHRILVVEDNTDLQYFYKTALELQGHEVVLANHGREALDMLRSGVQNPKMIILDLMMPVMDGWEFLRERKKDYSLQSIPVVVCSTSKDNLPEDIRCLRKPVRVDVLLQTVESYCTDCGSDVRSGVGAGGSA